MTLAPPLLSHSWASCTSRSMTIALISAVILSSVQLLAKMANAPVRLGIIPGLSASGKGGDTRSTRRAVSPNACVSPATNTQPGLYVNALTNLIASVASMLFLLTPPNYTYGRQLSSA